jgi:hypothetical protein
MGGDANPGIVELWIEGFEAGTDPAHPEYWGDIQDHDQRMVEAEMISVMLLAAPRERFWYCLSRQAQQNLISWLLSMNRKKMPPANWLWFRVFANLALLRTCEINTEEVRRQMADDLNNLDSFYMGEGWSSDGLWRSEELDREEWDIFQRTGKAHALRSSRSADYYSGSFAIQFSQLLYVRFAADLDPVRAERYRQQARDFGSGFWRFFDHEGMPSHNTRHTWHTTSRLNMCVRCRCAIRSLPHVSLCVWRLLCSTCSCGRTRYARSTVNAGCRERILTSSFAMVGP